MTEAKTIDQFSALLISNKNIIWSVGNKYINNEPDREDFFQDVALSAWSTFHLFRNECKFSTWLHRVAINKAAEKARSISNRIKTTALSNVLYEIVDDRQSSYETKSMYEYSLSQLSEPELNFVMLYAQGHSYHEMEKIIGVSQKNLRMRMNRIRERLKKYNR